MSASLLPNGKQQFIDINGAPLVGGSVYFYEPETSTLKDTWADPDQSILNSNPIILDSRGQAIIYGDGSYRQVVLDADNNTIWDQLTSAPASLDSPNFTGTPTINGQAIATVNYVNTALLDYAPLDSPDFTGIPTINGDPIVTESELSGILNTLILRTTIVSATGNFTRNPHCIFARVRLVGGGGSGGGCASGGNPSGRGASGGGAGGYSEKTFTAAQLDALGASITCTIGAGGAPPASGPNAGNAGGTTSFGTAISATGGLGGAAGTGGGGAFANNYGGTGGTATGGTINVAGQNGGSAFGGSTTSSSGIGFGGQGGDSLLGLGGAAITASNGGTPSNGAAGTGSGSGGAGSASSENSGTSAGGAGADGVIIIDEFCSE